MANINTINSHSHSMIYIALCAAEAPFLFGFQCRPFGGGGGGRRQSQRRHQSGNESSAKSSDSFWGWWKEWLYSQPADRQRRRRRRRRRRCNGNLKPQASSLKPQRLFAGALKDQMEAGASPALSRPRPPLSPSSLAGQTIEPTRGALIFAI